MHSGFVNLAMASVPAILLVKRNVSSHVQSSLSSSTPGGVCSEGQNFTIGCRLNPQVLPTAWIICAFTQRHDVCGMVGGGTRGRLTLPPNLSPPPCHVCQKVADMQQPCCEGCRLMREGVLTPLWAAETKVSNACYSTGACGHHYLSCGPDETIHLVALSYGFKPSSIFIGQGCQALLTNCDANVSTTACCQYNNNNDCLRSYSQDNQDKFHQKCDGQKDCTLPAAYGYGGCDGMDASDRNLASSFSLIQYKCESMSTGMFTSQTSTVTRPLESLSTKESEEGSSVSTTPQVTPCDTCTTLTHEQTQDTRQKTGKYDVLQLVIGVSVGAGLGVIALIIIACVCWIRIRRKPLPMNAITMRQAESRSVSDRTSTTRTLGSHRPSSVWSLPYSALETDTDILQSSHPDSVYSVPTDLLSSVSSFNYSAFLNNVGIGGGHVSSPRETIPNVVNGVLLLPARDGIMVNEILSMAQKSNGMVQPPEVPTNKRTKTNSVVSISSQTTETWPPEHERRATGQHPITENVTHAGNSDEPITNNLTSSSSPSDHFHRRRTSAAGGEREDLGLESSIQTTTVDDKRSLEKRAEENCSEEKSKYQNFFLPE